VSDKDDVSFSGLLDRLCGSLVSNGEVDLGVDSVRWIASCPISPGRTTHSD
jgi:hypothetical protein